MTRVRAVIAAFLVLLLFGLVAHHLGSTQSKAKITFRATPMVPAYKSGLPIEIEVSADSRLTQPIRISQRSVGNLQLVRALRNNTVVPLETSYLLSGASLQFLAASHLAVLPAKGSLKFSFRSTGGRLSFLTVDSNRPEMVVCNEISIVSSGSYEIEMAYQYAGPTPADGPPLVFMGPSEPFVVRFSVVD